MHDQIVEHLRNFIRFESTEHNPVQKKECLDWICSTFLYHDLPKLIRREHEKAPYVYLPNLSAPLLLFAHTDVVPANPEQFILTQKGTTVFGRGVKDMKGAALPFLLAYAEARENGEHPPVSILLTSDEEVAGKTIPTLLEQGMLRYPAAFTPDTGENPNIIVEHKGIVWARLTVHGKGGHGASPWESDNPIITLAEVILLLQKKFPHGTVDDWQITVTPTELRGSDARNKIPDTAVCGLDIRFPPQQYKTADDVLAAVQKVLPSNCDLSILLSSESLQTDASHPMVTLIKTIAEEVTGKKIGIGREHGGTDARYFANYQIPAFLYGPIGGGLHSANEWVSIDSLLEHYEMYKILFKKL